MQAMREELSDFIQHMSEIDAATPIPDDEWDFWRMTINLMTLHAAKVFDR